MEKLQKGMLIETNYSVPYRIVEITRGCTCSSYLDELNGRAKPRKPHIHIVCTRPNGKGRFYLNGWLEDTLRSLDKSYCGKKKKLGYDTIRILPEMQMTLF